MIYFITFESSISGYYNLLKLNNNLTIIGSQTDYYDSRKKISKIIQFCQKTNKDDIICFIDPNQTIILDNPQSITEKFKSLNTQLVFSVYHPSSVINKYLTEKKSGRCSNYLINHQYYMGYPDTIIQLWSDYEFIQSEQQFITQKCFLMKKNIIIDTTFMMFYHYDSNNKHIFRQQQLFVNNNNHSSSILIPSSDPKFQINQFINVKQLPKDVQKDINIKKKKNQLAYNQSSSFIKHWIPEIIILLICLLITYYQGINLLTVIAIFILLFLFFNHQLYVKHLPISNYKKTIVFAIDLLHIVTIMIMIYILLMLLWGIIQRKCNLTYLFLFNISGIAAIYLGLKFKRCIYSIVNDQIAGKTKPFSISYKYFTEKNLSFYQEITQLDKKQKENYLFNQWKGDYTKFARNITLINIIYFGFYLWGKCK